MFNTNGKKLHWIEYVPLGGFAQTLNYVLNCNFPLGRVTPMQAGNWGLIQCCKELLLRCKGGLPATVLYMW